MEQEQKNSQALANKAVFVNEDEKKSLLANLKTKKEEVEVTADYFEPEMGEINRAIFLGTVDMKDDEGQHMQGVKLLLDADEKNLNGRMVVSASSFLVNNLIQLPVKSPVSIVKVEDGQNKAGRSYHKFSIKLLA